MTNLEKAVEVMARHEGGWTRDEQGVVCRGYDCNYRPTLGEYHGLHVAKDMLLRLGLPE